VISSSQRPLPDNTQHSQQTNIYAPGGTQTYDLSRRAAAELRLRPRGHWDRQLNTTAKQNTPRKMVTICTCFREEFGLNPHGNTGYSERVFSRTALILPDRRIESTAVKPKPLHLKTYTIYISSVTPALGIRLDIFDIATRLQVGRYKTRFLEGTKNVSLLQNVQNDAESPHPPTEWVSRFCPGDKTTGALNYKLSATSCQS